MTLVQLLEALTGEGVAPPVRNFLEQVETGHLIQINRLTEAFNSLRHELDLLETDMQDSRVALNMVIKDKMDQIEHLLRGPAAVPFDG